MTEDSAALRDRVVATFVLSFGRQPDHIVEAPGRVNLIGEHTDYNDGFVLPIAIDRSTVVAIGRTSGANVDVVACDRGDARDRYAADMPTIPAERGSWTAHVRGIAAALGGAGFPIGGAEIAFGGNVPQGGGLSSSASLGVALARALSAAFHDDRLGPATLARIAQRAENEFVGCACGIMDQLASARASAGYALLIDCRTLATRDVAIPDGLAISVIDSGIARELVDSAYNTRRRECERAARHYRVTALRDLDADRLVSDRGDLDDVVFARARPIS